MEKTLPKVAVLMAAYNGMEFIENQVESIFKQEAVNIDLYISVDLSEDRTFEWCLQLAKSTKNVVILDYGMRFGGAAKNFYRLISDVDFTEYDFISLSDQDDLWLKDKLSHSIKTMKNKRVDAYSANVFAFWPDGRQRLINKSQPQTVLDYFFEAAGPGCTYVFTKKAASFIKDFLNDHPQMNDFILHDWLSYAVLRHHDFKWYIDPVPKMQYRQHANNQVGANTNVKGMVYRFQYVASGHVFQSIELLINAFGIENISLKSRLSIFKLAFNAYKLRRRQRDKVMIFFTLLFYSIKGTSQ